MDTVYNALKNQIQITRRVNWSDAMVTISWIKAYKKESKVFVENRAQEIRKNSNPNDWYYCESPNNPADLPKRKRTIENFKENILWWEGSNFLKDGNFIVEEEPIENF